MDKFYQDSWQKFNKASIKVLIGMMVLLFGLSWTYAWFTDSDHTSTETDTGNIYVELHSAMDTIDIIAPNETIDYESMVYVVGKPTTADAYIRISYTAYIGDDDVTEYISPILYNTAEYILKGQSAWVYSETDKRYYYVGYTNETTPVVFCDGFHVREDFPKAFANKTVIFTIDVDSIQRNYRAYETEPGWVGNYPEKWASMLDEYNINVDQVDDTIQTK